MKGDKMKVYVVNWHLQDWDFESHVTLRVFSTKEKAIEFVKSYEYDDENYSESDFEISDFSCSKVFQIPKTEEQYVAVSFKLNGYEVE